MNRPRLNKYILNILIVFSSLTIIGCGGEDPLTQGPSSITLSHQSFYEKLPKDTNVAILGTNASTGNISYSLVSGEGSTHNAEFKIESNFLRNAMNFNHSDGTTKEIRIKVSDGTSDYEETFVIDILKLEGEEPEVTSASFLNNANMPDEFGADNGNVSPDLELSNVPSNCNSIALLMIDEDAVGSVHWAVWNIPNSTTSIRRNQSWFMDTVVGDNSFGEGYIGPFPPTTHRYKTTAFFVSEKIDLESSEFGKLKSEMTGKLIAQASINGKYTP